MAKGHKARRLTKPGDDYAVGSHEVFQERHERYGETKVDTLRVRRVEHPERGEELQIEVSTTKYFEKSGRSAQSFESFCLSPEQADVLAAACSTLRKKEAA